MTPDAPLFIALLGQRPCKAAEDATDLAATTLLPPFHQTEISLQPWRAFKPDGIILFSDILTPLAGMNIPFDIVPGKGPLIDDPIRNVKVP